MANEGSDALPPPNKNTTPKNYLDQFQGKEASKFTEFVPSLILFLDSDSPISNSPCAEASKASMACMNKYDFDRDKCLDYFQAYRDCKKAWVSDSRNRQQTRPAANFLSIQIDQRKADRRAGRPSG
ncbi:Mitochondrial copper homeostasis protein [Marasmius crinis-equi]|uniref:Cytochrome c oxidase-assembly factor COX23, mitochondrial n=1 Tax=Marasmius crinis-equi TaxID=585013 RepID=A0ABR3FIU8_9AGAR